jgi:hypothetical protein
LLFGWNQRPDGAPVAVEILSRHSADILARHLSDPVKIGVQLAPATGDFVITKFHRLSEDRILVENESGFDLIFGFLQFTLSDQL